MVDLQLIKFETERRKLKSLFLGSLISCKRKNVVAGLVIDVCTVETLDHILGVDHDNKFKVLSGAGICLVPWRSCKDISSFKSVDCWHVFELRDL